MLETPKDLNTNIISQFIVVKNFKYNGTMLIMDNQQETN